MQKVRLGNLGSKLPLSRYLSRRYCYPGFQSCLLQMCVESEHIWQVVWYNSIQYTYEYCCVSFRDKVGFKFKFLFESRLKHFHLLVVLSNFPGTKLPYASKFKKLGFERILRKQQNIIFCFMVQSYLGFTQLLRFQGVLCDPFSCILIAIIGLIASVNVPTFYGTIHSLPIKLYNHNSWVNQRCLNYQKQNTSFLWVIYPCARDTFYWLLAISSTILIH